MSKKHFIALANHIKRCNQNPLASYHLNPGQINDLADFCASQNPNFKRDRWIAYIKGECGPNGGSIKKAA